MADDRKRALILLNPSAGAGRAGENALEIAAKFAGKGYEPVIYPIIPGSELGAESIIRRYDGQVDIILCSGGDGTLHHVMQGLMRLREQPRIAYIPAGSTNDFARALGIPTEFDRALETALGGEIFSYDVGCINDSFFNYVAAFGAFSAISYKTDQSLKNIFGHAAYIMSALGELKQHIHTRYHMSINTGDSVEEGDYIFGALCNSVSVGGFKMFRDADVTLDDGRLELLLIRAPRSAADLQGVVNALLRGTLDHPDITFRQVTEAVLSADREVPWALDGEYGGDHREVRISVKKRAVSIMVEGKGQ